MRYLLTIAYHGGTFDGWQSQAAGTAVQDRIEQALFRITGEAVRLHGAGRTDAGVHALGQTAHFDAPSNTQLTASNWKAALNYNLPTSVQILKVTEVAPDFHARFDAIGKHYRYVLSVGDVQSPLDADRSWFVRGNLDTEALRAALGLYIGTHDFRAFCVGKLAEQRCSIRTITEAKLSEREGKWEIDIYGNGFLHKMVRILTALSVKAALKKISLSEIQNRLEHPDFASNRFIAPAQGLFLIRVFYEKI